MMHSIVKAYIIITQLWVGSSANLFRGGSDEGSDNGIEEFAVASSNIFKDTRIIGGNEAVEDRYSYSVSLQGSNGHFCGGSLIAKDVVLTAAHCMGGSYNVVIGRHDFGDKDGDVVSMKREIIHPNYNTQTDENDFALVFLSRPTTANVKLVKVNKNNGFPSAGATATVTGWGDTDQKDDKQTLPDALEVVNVKVISNTECAKASGKVGSYSDSYEDYIFDNMMCTFTDGQDACQGDSGGPLVIRGSDSMGAGDVQVGVVSWGIGCATKVFPGVYSRVSTAYSWINKNVCDQSAVPPGHLCGTPNPTRRPTRRPTPNPTKVPTRPPTPNPTKQPTRNPTAEPTPSPTNDPTTSPSQDPTGSPTSQPSDYPSASPSSQPSSVPSLSSQPSSSPSENPSISLNPTNFPTSSPSSSMEPTQFPSASPSISTAPTSQPSSAPSTSPQPSSSPSSSPSDIPSKSPSASPTNTPTQSNSPTTSPAPTKDRRSIPGNGLLIPASAITNSENAEDANGGVCNYSAGAIITSIVSAWVFLML